MFKKEIPELQKIERLSKELLSATKVTTREEARYFVDNYYRVQKQRIQIENQIESLKNAGKEVSLLDWFAILFRSAEGQVKKLLDAYSEEHHMGRWAKGVRGIGPVIASGLLAHIDIEKAQTAGAIWRFAGLDPTSVWEKGQKRPWNAKLKVLCWKIGESFVKVSSRDDDFYGHIYQARRGYEDHKNLKLDYKEQADARAQKVGKDTEAYIWYRKGMLPPGHIYQRCKRYAVKLFLAHWFEEAYVTHHGKKPPLPYPIAHMGHVHYIERPNPTKVGG